MKFTIQTRKAPAVKLPATAGRPKYTAQDWDFAYLGINETQYLTHFFHHWTAKFIPQIPARIIEQHSQEGQAVLDPFMGCGTTLVEAAIRRRPAYGTDINPLAVKIARAKSSPINSYRLLELLDELQKCKKSNRCDSDGEDTVLFPGSEAWFRPDVSTAIGWVLAYIRDFDKSTRNFIEVGLSDLLKGLSNARMDQTVPKLPSEPEYIDKKHYHRIVNNLTRKIDVYGRLFTQLARMHKALLEFQNRAGDTECRPILADARELHLHVPPVRLAITSPPYWNAQNYQKLHWLSFQVLSLTEPGKDEIGRRKHDYLEDMRAVLRELAVVLDGIFAIVIGESQLGTHELVRDSCIEVGMKPVETIKRKIAMHAFFAKGVTTEFIYLFQNKSI